MIQDEKLLFKIMMIGDCGVGKSSLVGRVCDDQFSENNSSTIGASINNITFPIDGKQIQLQIWDTAGQERFRSLSPLYYRGAEGIIIVFDVSNEVSFKNIEQWLNSMKNHLSSDAQIMLIGNKIDQESRQVSTETAQEYAQSKQMDFFEVSAKTSDSVKQAFLHIARKIKNKIEAKDPIKLTEQTFHSSHQKSQNKTIKQINLEASNIKEICC